MSALRLPLVAGAALLLVTPLTGAAQQQEEPETRIMTVTVFHVPLGEAREQFMEYVDQYIVPQTMEDPHVLSFRVAVHNWGTNKPNVWLITEYESLSAIDRSDAWGEMWFDEHYPEGSPEEEAAQKAFEEIFAPYFSTHMDNILSVNMNRAK